MYVVYNGEHSIIFENQLGEKRHTWNDWRLVPTAKPTVPTPEPDTKYVDIPGRSGSIDMSEFLTGNISYKDRSGSWEFYLVDTDIHQDWDEMCSYISEFLHGKNLKITLKDDPLYKYEGRVTLSGKNTDGPIPKITLNYRVGPFKTFIGNNSELKF